MCQRPKTQDEDGVPGSSDRVSGTTRPPPYPQMLQFIEIGVGGAVSTPSIVRSHAIKGYHQKRKDAKKAYLKSKNVQVRPIEIAPRHIAKTSRKAHSATHSSEEAEKQQGQQGSLEGETEPEEGLEVIPRESNQLSFSAKVQYRADCELISHVLSTDLFYA